MISSLAPLRLPVLAAVSLYAARTFAEFSKSENAAERLMYKTLTLFACGLSMCALSGAGDKSHW
jgi:hypothetical protein